MKSLAWPKLFSNNGSSTLLFTDKEAIKSNLKLLLNSEKLSLFGDPYYGVKLKPILFEPTNTIIVDLIIDEILTAIHTYIPQIIVTRNSINIYSDKINLYVELMLTYTLDNSTDLYIINLTNNDQEI